MSSLQRAVLHGGAIGFVAAHIPSAPPHLQRADPVLTDVCVDRKLMRIRAQKRSKLTKRKTLLNSFETCERKGLAQPNVPTPHQAPKARRPANHPPAREPAAFPCSAMLLQLIPVLHVAFTLSESCPFPFFLSQK